MKMIGCMYVHVYPKNKSTYGGVTLQKKGQIGSKTPTKLERVQIKLKVKSADGYNMDTGY